MCKIVTSGRTSKPGLVSPGYMAPPRRKLKYLGACRAWKWRKANINPLEKKKKILTLNVLDAVRSISLQVNVRNFGVDSTVYSSP